LHDAQTTLDLFQLLNIWLLDNSNDLIIGLNPLQSRLSSCLRMTVLAYYLKVWKLKHIFLIC